MISLYLLRVAADTLLVRQAPPDRTGFEQLVFVAGGLAQVASLAMLVLLAIIFIRMWKAQQAMQEQLGRLTSKVEPMIASVSSAAETVRVLTDIVRKDAVAAAGALSQATSRVRDSVSGIADRVDDFGDLMGRVHDNADAVVDVAGAAMHTIKLGSRMLRPGQRHARDEERPGEHRRHEAHRRDARPAPAPAARDERAEGEAREPVAPEAERFDDELDEPRRLGDDDDAESPYADNASEQPRRPRRRRRRRRGGGGNAGNAGTQTPL